MNSEFRKDRRDAYFLGAKGWRKVQVERQHGRSLWYSLALIGVAIVAMRIIVDLL